jgi:hypothetical protein
LHSSTLERLGLIAGVKGFCKEFSDQQEIQIDFVHENVPAGIPADAALCLFASCRRPFATSKSSAVPNELRFDWNQGRGDPFVNIGWTERL